MMTHSEILSNIMKGGNIKSAPIKFIWNNCGQCFDCKHCEGTRTIHRAGKWWEHPVCGIDEKIMVEVYNISCPKRIPRKEERRIT